MCLHIIQILIAIIYTFVPVTQFWPKVEIVPFGIDLSNIRGMVEILGPRRSQKPYKNAWKQSKLNKQTNKNKNKNKQTK